MVKNNWNQYRRLTANCKVTLKKNWKSTGWTYDKNITALFVVLKTCNKVFLRTIMCTTHCSENTENWLYWENWKMHRGGKAYLHRVERLQAFSLPALVGRVKSCQLVKGRLWFQGGLPNKRYTRLLRVSNHRGCQLRRRRRSWPGVTFVVLAAGVYKPISSIGPICGQTKATLMI